MVENRAERFWSGHVSDHLILNLYLCVLSQDHSCTEHVYIEVRLVAYCKSLQGAVKEIPDEHKIFGTALTRTERVQWPASS